MYYTEDTDYKYKIAICAESSEEDRAVQQHGKKWPDGKWTTVGQYNGAHVTGGSKYLCCIIVQVTVNILKRCLITLHRLNCSLVFLK